MPESKEEKQADQNFSIFFTFDTITDNGTIREMSECGQCVIAKGKVMLLHVYIEPGIGMQEEWARIKFSSKTHTLNYSQPPKPDFYYPITLVPKNQSEEEPWPHSFLVNKAMFDKLQEGFITQEVPPQRFRIRLFKITPRLKPTPQPVKISACGFFY